MPTIDDLKYFQAMPLNLKVRMTIARIREWVSYYGEEGVYVSFSGGKDSTVLLHIIREQMGLKKIPAVFVNTGLEFPEIVQFVKTFDNVVIIRPKYTFKQVIEKYGYPFVSKDVSRVIFYAKRDGYKTKEGGRGMDRLYGLKKDKNGGYSQFNVEKWKFMISAPFNVGGQCCSIMKKSPIHKYAHETKRVAITGQTADESRLRTQQWLKKGCNAFDNKNPISNPMSFWTEQDILHYIYENKVNICSVYGDVIPDVESEVKGQSFISDYIDMDTSTIRFKTTGCKRTGCMFCGFGCHLEQEGEGRFELMKKTHPKIYEWIMKPKEEGGLDYKNIIDWMNENGNLNIRY